jgi:hypothetical protein
VFLSGVRRQALRRKVWYSALDTLERGILSISAKIIDGVKSILLNEEIVKIIAKLRDASKSRFVKHLERFGAERVGAFRANAERIGFLGAADLSKDLAFIRYLIFLDYNQPIGWRIHEQNKCVGLVSSK